MTCKSTLKVDIPNDWKQFDLTEFKISVPSTWHFKIDKGVDSFVGQINGPNVHLSFDCSDMGYANHLVSSDDVDVKNYSISSYSTNEYFINLIRPKVAGHGITGVYIHSQKSSFNFQMNAKDLSAKDEADALKAFKTITFKK